MPDEAFTLEQVAVNGANVVRPRGPLTMANLFTFQNAVRELRGQPIVLDLAGVPYVDSAGLGALVNGHVSAQRNGGKFVLAGVVPRVRDLLQLTRVESIFEYYPSAEEAVAGLSRT